MMVGGDRPSRIDKVREAIRVRRYSIRTEDAYIGWIRRYIRFHGRRYRREIGEAEVRAFLSHLAVIEDVAARTQNQALNALVFLHKAMLERPLGEISGVVRAKKPQRLPVVLTVDEAGRVLGYLGRTRADGKRGKDRWMLRLPDRGRWWSGAPSRNRTDNSCLQGSGYTV